MSSDGFGGHEIHASANEMAEGDATDHGPSHATPAYSREVRPKGPLWVISSAMAASTFFSMLQAPTVSNRWMVSLHAGSLATSATAMLYMYVRKKTLTSKRQISQRTREGFQEGEEAEDT